MIEKLAKLKINALQRGSGNHRPLIFGTGKDEIWIELKNNKNVTIYKKSLKFLYFKDVSKAMFVNLPTEASSFVVACVVPLWLRRLATSASRASSELLTKERAVPI